MIEQTTQILNKKHLLIIGKTATARKLFINDLLLNTNFEVFRFPSKMKLFDEYIDYVKMKKLYEPWYKAKSYSTDQIFDFHFDWISESSSLVIIEEIQYLEETWQIELLRIYLNVIENRKKGEEKIHLIISQESENNLISKLSKVIDIRDNERRTSRQIVEQNLKVIDLN
ncbi:hypothetical protein [Tenacibaculum sp. M341]|uniref:hypothetical protein n=1 Tax=Tenacibaculum sp. M341 TaxID=2530339 RepID=UPI0010508584|nr:hypothetical protein [Tenacibaculum sp. M341]TCI92709.1 hypothetical protein EYW44_07370 [Tenacibaculum sp. M341]